MRMPQIIQTHETHGVVRRAGIAPRFKPVILAHINSSLQEVRWNRIHNVSSHKDVAESQVDIQASAQPTVGNVDHTKRGDA